MAEFSTVGPGVDAGAGAGVGAGGGAVGSGAVFPFAIRQQAITPITARINKISRIIHKIAKLDFVGEGPGVVGPVYPLWLHPKNSPILPALFQSPDPYTLFSSTRMWEMEYS